MSDREYRAIQNTSQVRHNRPNKGQVPWIAGKTHSAATVRAMSERMIGSVVAAETRAKISASLTGRVFGPRSDEARARIRAANIVRNSLPVGEGTRAKMRASRLAFLQRKATG